MSICWCSAVRSAHTSRQTHLYMSLVKFSNRLHSGNSNSRKAIEQWWFSKGEMSLYLLFFVFGQRSEKVDVISEWESEKSLSARARRDLP